MNFEFSEFEWVNPAPFFIPVSQAAAIIEAVCRDWVTCHPEDVDLQWQRIIFKVMRHSALRNGCSMFISHSKEGLLISDFKLIDRDSLAIPFHG